MSPRALPGGVTSGYGFGWKVCTFAGKRTISHGGYINGYLANATRLPDDGIFLAVLVNNDSDAPDPSVIVRRVIRHLFTGSPEVRPYPLRASKRAALAGTYAIGPDDALTITDRDGVLFRRQNEGEARPLVALGPAQLTPAEIDAGWTLDFTLAPDGTATKVLMSLGCEPKFIGLRVAD